MRVQIAVNLRRKNQLTLPQPIADRLGAKPGDRLVFETDGEEPGVIHVRRLLSSYAGVAAGVYGRTPEEIAEYIRAERASWGQ